MDPRNFVTVAPDVGHHGNYEIASCEGRSAGNDHGETEKREDRFYYGSSATDCFKSDRGKVPVKIGGHTKWMFDVWTVVF